MTMLLSCLGMTVPEVSQIKVFGDIYGGGSFRVFVVSCGVNYWRTLSPESSSLFEGMSHLQQPNIVAMPTNNLNTDG